MRKVKMSGKQGGAADPLAEDMMKNVDAIFGSDEEYENSSSNLYTVAKRLNEQEIEKPIFYLCCGSEDLLAVQMNSEIMEFVKREAPNLNFTFQMSEGIHDWDFWDREIVTVLKFFGLLPGDFVRK